MDIPYPATEVKDDGTVVVNRVRALWDFKAEREEQLEFSKGDVIIVLNQSDECAGWWYGELDEDLPPMEGERGGEGEGEGTQRKRGMFPVNYVEVVEIERLIVRKMKIDRSKVSDRIRLLQMKMKAAVDDSASESETESSPFHDEEEGLPSESAESAAALTPPRAPAAPGAVEKSSETAPTAPAAFEPARAEKARKMREARERRRRVMREEAAAAKKAAEEAAGSDESDEESSDGESSDDNGSGSDHDSDREAESGSDNESGSGSGSESDNDSEGEGEHELVDEEDIEEEILNDKDIDLEEEKQWERLAVRQLSVSGSDAESSGSEIEVTEDMLNEIRLQRASRRRRIRQQRKRTPSQLRSADAPPPPTPPMVKKGKDSASESPEANTVNEDSAMNPVKDSAEAALGLKGTEKKEDDLEDRNCQFQDEHTGESQAEKSGTQMVKSEEGDEMPAVQSVTEDSAEEATENIKGPEKEVKEETKEAEKAVAEAIKDAKEKAEKGEEAKEEAKEAPEALEQPIDQAPPIPAEGKTAASVKDEAAASVATPPEMKARRKIEPMRHASSTVWEAVVAGDLEFLRRFLAADEFKVMVNGRNERGQSALHVAVVAQQKAVCEMLVREGASVSVLDRNNCMPHRLAGCTPELRRAILSNVCLQPTWVPDSTSTHCMLCECKFTLFHRRHHCRNCGTLACSHCCSTKKAVPNLDIADRVRVCIDCSEVLE